MCAIINWIGRPLSTGNLTCGVPVTGNTETGMTMQGQGRTNRDHFWLINGPNQRREEFEFVLSNVTAPLTMGLYDIDAAGSAWVEDFMNSVGSSFGSRLETVYVIQPPGGTVVAALDPGITGVMIEAATSAQGSTVAYQLVVTATGYSEPAYQGETDRRRSKRTCTLFASASGCLAECVQLD